MAELGDKDPGLLKFTWGGEERTNNKYISGAWVGGSIKPGLLISVQVMMLGVLEWSPVLGSWLSQESA